MRALLFFVLVVVVFVLIRFVFKRLDHFRQTETSNEAPTESAEQTMVRCEECGVHLPEKDAISVEATRANGETAMLHFCSKEHLESYLDQRQN